MADEYKPSPFNYCDYRCDQCEEREHCRVYKDDQERLLDHYRKGEDPYDPNVFMEDLKEIFGKTEKMLRKMAKEQDIDLDETDDVEVPEVNPEEYVIYRLAYNYFKEANSFIKVLDKTGISENLQPDLDDFVWYHTLIAAKTGRLVSGFIDDFLDEEYTKVEEEGTIGVIRKGIKLSRNALERMLDELPDHFYTIADLLDILRRIDKQLEVDIRQKV
jgi:hypothetical protein